MVSGVCGRDGACRLSPWRRLFRQVTCGTGATAFPGDCQPREVAVRPVGAKTPSICRETLSVIRFPCRMRLPLHVSVKLASLKGVHALVDARPDPSPLGRELIVGHVGYGAHLGELLKLDATVGNGSIRPNRWGSSGAGDPTNDHPGQRVGQLLSRPPAHFFSGAYNTVSPSGARPRLPSRTSP
jgi:hypothetical protein